MTFRYAWKRSIPVMAGYIVLGMGFGMLLAAKGYGVIWAIAMKNCKECPCYRKDWKKQRIPSEKKQIKRDNISRGCNKLAEICKELGLQGKTLTWDTDTDGNWAENVKGVDDYLVALQHRE